jgi:RNA polymerase sigma factor (sigma-70 family)
LRLVVHRSILSGSEPLSPDDPSRDWRRRLGPTVQLSVVTAGAVGVAASLVVAACAGRVCNGVSGRDHLRDVTATDINRVVPVSGSSRLEFESVYRENIRPVTAFFARRCRDPQQVADMTSQTFVEAIKSAGTFQGRGSATAWLIAIARRVYANHLADQAVGVDLIGRLGGRLVLADDEVEDLAARIDAQRDGRELLDRLAGLPDIEREAIELVDLLGLTPRDAAGVLGVSANVLRVRLFRAHQRLGRELGDDRL